MITDMKAKVDVMPMDVYTEGDQEYVKQSKFGELFTADWKQRLIRAGLCWQGQVGGITASADILPVTGGGNGTVMDTGQPEFTIGVAAGYYLIPIEAHVSTYAHITGDKDILTLLLFVDRTMSPISQTATGVAVTPVNLLDGANSVFPGTSWKQASADITACPVCTEVLDFECTQFQHAAASGAVSPAGLKMDYQPEAPSILAGPCQVVLCWGATSTSGAAGIGTVKVAVVPSSYFATS